MLKNRKELLTWLISERRIDDETNVIIDRKLPKDLYIPMKYDGIYEPVGMYTVWDEVGGIAASGLAWRPVGGGTVLFGVH